MTDETVTHEIKLDKSLKTILWALAIGVVLNAIPQQLLVDKNLGYLRIQLENSEAYRPLLVSHILDSELEVNATVSNGDVTGFRINN